MKGRKSQRARNQSPSRAMSKTKVNRKNRFQKIRNKRVKLIPRMSNLLKKLNLKEIRMWSWWCKGF